MKPGDLIGIGRDKHVSLYCRIEEVTPEYLKFWVINGAWTGYMRGDEIQAGYQWDGKFHCQNTIHGEKIIYADPIPSGLNYNEAIEYMNDQLSSNWLMRKWNVLRLGANCKASMQLSRFNAACRAFMLVWRGDKVSSDFDDPIPF